MSEHQLEGKVCIITGATSGMGQGMAELFASEGASIAVSGRNAERGAKVVGSIRQAGGKAEFIATDVTDEESVKNLVDKATRTFGGVDVLVANAGILGIGSVTEISSADWLRAIDTNLNAVFFLCKHGIPGLIKRGGGKILVNGSIGAFKGFPNHPAYCATKAAVVALTRVLALDHAKDNIRANCLCPGQVDTPLLWDSAKAFPDPETVVQEVAQRMPLKRLGTPADIAEFALFLISDKASWVTGQHFTIDGGIMAGGG